MLFPLAESASGREEAAGSVRNRPVLRDNTVLSRWKATTKAYIVLKGTGDARARRLEAGKTGLSLQTATRALPGVVVARFAMLRPYEWVAFCWQGGG